MLIPVILSGGSGSRLWPVSREAHPKPFMRLADGESLLQKTFQRAAALENVAEILTVTNRDYYFKTKDDYAEVLHSDLVTRYLLEPVGRNTAPAIALSALQIAEQHGQDALMLVLAADHLIENQELFNASVRQATALAVQGKLITFGIVPTEAETGYGYIECGTACDDQGSCEVANFAEKPSQEVALEFLHSGKHLWNSGMFCFRVGTVLDELRVHAPEVMNAAEACWKATQTDSELSYVTEINEASFVHVPDISIDYAVMETSDKVAVVPGDFGWSDIGSWGAMGELVPPDKLGNRVQGEAILVDSSNTFIRSEERLVAAIGLENITIIDTPDAILIANRDRLQDVKKVVQQLKLEEHDAYRIHRTVSRPWGTYTVLEEGERFKIKRIVVKPGAALSLQMHHHRSEHWIVVSGAAKVMNGDKELFVQTNESTYIPAGHQHRLENPGLMDLIMIEVQSGEYLGEDDIVRFDDIYGRV